MHSAAAAERLQIWANFIQIVLSLRCTIYMCVSVCVCEWEREKEREREREKKWIESDKMYDQKGKTEARYVWWSFIWQRVSTSRFSQNKAVFYQNTFVFRQNHEVKMGWQINKPSNIYLSSVSLFSTHTHTHTHIYIYIYILFRSPLFVDLSVTTKFTSEEVNMGNNPSKKAGGGRKLINKTSVAWRFSSRDPMGFLKSNGV